jgi:small subunit ribosomal protein S1
VASRKAAMLKLRRRFYLTTGENSRPLIYPGRKAEARIVAVSQLVVRVEVFGVETPIRHRALSRAYVGDCRNEYFVGDTIQVRVTAVNGDKPENLEIAADVISLTADDTHEKLMALKPQTNCIGKVVDIIDGVIFLNLVDGVRAISHKCYDKRTPGRGDDVMFIITRIDEGTKVALGIISRIIKRNI